MAIQLSVAVREARLNSIETQIGTSPVLRIWAGTPRASCATADDGTAANLLAEIALPSDWMAAAGTPGAGQKGIAGGPWTDSSANNTGTAAYFRIYATGGTTCHLQGTVGTSGADMIVDNTSFAAGQQFSITSFTLTDGNA